MGLSEEGEEGDAEVNSGAIDSDGGERRSAGSKWYFAECNAAPPLPKLVNIRTRKGEPPLLTKQDVLQLFAELLIPPNRHCFLGRVLRQIELDVGREIILSGTGLPGIILHIIARTQRRRKQPRTLILQNLVSLPAPILTI